MKKRNERTFYWLIFQRKVSLTPSQPLIGGRIRIQGYLEKFAIDLEDEEPGDDCEDWDQFFQTRDGADDDFYNIIEVFEKKGYNIGNICTGIVNPATVFSYLIDYTKQDLTGLSHLGGFPN